MERIVLFWFPHLFFGHVLISLASSSLPPHPLNVGVPYELILGSLLSSSCALSLVYIASTSTMLITIFLAPNFESPSWASVSFHIHMSTCLVDVVIWMSSRHLKFSVSRADFRPSPPNQTFFQHCLCWGIESLPISSPEP